MSSILIDTPYAGLTPELILQALEQLDLQPTGALLALNSYENRVYQAALDDKSFVVVKFYRPGRWSDAAILEEHGFAYELAEQEIPVITPLRFAGKSLLEYAGYRYAVYPLRGGRWPELDNKENLQLLGRLLGRIHRVGRSGRFAHRERLTVEHRGRDALAYLQQSELLPNEIKHNFVAAVAPLLDTIEQQFEAVGANTLRLHGDCHPGNILWTPDGPHFVDLDDCCTGPAMQDLWMLLSGTQDEMAAQLLTLLEGYETFSVFDYAEIQLIEALRGLRLIHYCAWLARRWHDPAFPHHFPWFNTPRYWEEQIVTFREQLERCYLPPIRLH
ncbi:MAG: serine/threonine protein kinase [Gammaproteobacteria bacterium]|nr:serine/threonine protein kinase [Gammaproteobacteria bacterium]